MAEGEQIKGPVAVIMNPHSGGGRTGKHWTETQQKLEAAIGPVTVRATKDTGHAIDLTREVLRDGAQEVIAVGGDGTISEVVNGFFVGDSSNDQINPTAVLSLLMKGTGGDFRKSFDLPTDEDEQIARMLAVTPRKIDLGRIDLTGHDGQPVTRYFNNISSAGMSGTVCVNVNGATWQKWFGGSFAFNWAVYTSVLFWRGRQVRVEIDDQLVGSFAINTAAVANGKYFGSGMMVAPEADPSDGLFDVTIIHNAKLADIASNSGKMKAGTLYDMEEDKVVARRGRKVVMTPEDDKGPVYLEVDGETPGMLPATWQILPGALTIRV